MLNGTVVNSSIKYIKCIFVQFWKKLLHLKGLPRNVFENIFVPVITGKITNYVLVYSSGQHTTFFHFYINSID